MRTYDTDGWRYTGYIKDLIRHGDQLRREIRPDLWVNTKEYTINAESIPNQD